MAEADFLELLQAVEGVRRCVGQDCFDILDKNVVQARGMAERRDAHSAEREAPEHVWERCPECETIKGEGIALRTILQTQGVEFPIGLLEG